jgi:hypothetical protein
MLLNNPNILFLSNTKVAKIQDANEILCEPDEEDTDKDSRPTKLYRIEYYYNEDGIYLYLQIYYVVAYTPAGYWIGTTYKAFPEHNTKERWISATGKKRFAYPTKREAIISFVARKRKHLIHAQRRFHNVELVAHGAELLLKQMNENENS